MKIKYVSVLVVLAAVALFLLLLWRVGPLGTEQEISPDIQAQVSKEGVYAQLSITPEAGILAGDILYVTINVFFDQSRIKIDESLIAERYIRLKESSFAGCEEYIYPELNHGKIKKISYISLLVEFQCFFTEERKEAIDFSVQYVNKESSQTSTIHLNQRISFAKISTTNARDFQNYVHERENSGFWLITLGIMLCIATVAFMVVYVVRDKRSRTLAVSETELEPKDYFSSTIDILRSGIGTNDPRNILDKLYHLCCQIIEERGTNEELELLKNKLLIIYDPQIPIEKARVEDYLDEAAQIAGKEGEAKC